MKVLVKGLEMSVNFNVSVKADKVSGHNKNIVDNRTTFDDNICEGVNANAGFNINIKAESYDNEIDLKELTEALNSLISKSVSEVKQQVEEQEVVKEETEVETPEVEVKELSKTTNEEPYSDGIDGDEIANLMC